MHIKLESQRLSLRCLSDSMDKTKAKDLAQDTALRLDYMIGKERNIRMTYFLSPYIEE